jgi:hypothetical protein
MCCGQGHGGKYQVHFSASPKYELNKPIYEDARVSSLDLLSSYTPETKIYSIQGDKITEISLPSRQGNYSVGEEELGLYETLYESKMDTGYTSRSKDIFGKDSVPNFAQKRDELASLIQNAKKQLL